MPIHATCRQCGGDYVIKPYLAATTKYCSRRCLGLASRQQITASCACCGIQFTHISSRANHAKYCSPKCYHKGQVGQGLTDYVCRHCGETFRDSASHKRVYCSRACVNKANKIVWKPDFLTVRKNMKRRDMILTCARCEYSANPQILGVHHKDRDRTNNALNNLEVLCPNCHSVEHAKHIAHGFTE